MTRRLAFPALAAALALAGCSDRSAEQPVDPTAEATRPPPDTSLAPGQARETLQAEDIAGAALAGELSCAFVERGAAAPLLVAAADVIDTARAEGVLRLGPAALRLRAAEPGGFNAMVYGERFTSGDLAAQVIVTSRTPEGEGESPPLPARLVLASDAGADEVAGTWTCGP